MGLFENQNLRSIYKMGFGKSFSKSKVRKQEGSCGPKVTILKVAMQIETREG